MDDEHTRLLRGLLAVVTDLSALTHSGQVGRVLLAAAVAGRGCSDDAIARTASMPVAAVREILPSANTPIGFSATLVRTAQLGTVKDREAGRWNKPPDSTKR